MGDFGRGNSGWAGDFGAALGQVWGELGRGNSGRVGERGIWGILLAIVVEKRGYEKNCNLLRAGSGSWGSRNGLYSAAAEAGSETACAGGAAGGTECGQF
jgi:hypothetical protein